MKKSSLLLSLLLAVCFASPGYAKVWSPERLYTGFTRAINEAKPNGGLISVQGPVAKFVADDAGNPVLVLGNEDNYTVWCYMATDQDLAGIKKGQKKTVQGRSARKIPSYEAVQMHNCRFE